MENITVYFKNWAEMNQAAAALREQGAIDIKLESNGDTSLGAESMVSSMTGSEPDTAPGCIMQVVVESSRFRQAEDTIAKFGGNYL